MNKVAMYQYSKCGTCRDAVKSLTSRGVEVNKIELFDHPPSPQELKRLIELSGLESKKFFNTSGEVYKEMQLKDKVASMSEAEKIALLCSNGRLIKRPIVTDGLKVTVGYKEEEFIRMWGAPPKK
ncbi:MAG TPA: Spx/MgsR family RNA polymerase-binding regulatory protein [Bacilli bacterium]